MIEWINNFFGIKNEVSVPTLISLIVFIVGGIIKYFFEKIREFNQRRINRKTFILLLEELLKDLKTKEKNINKFHIQINLLNEESFTFTQNPISYLETVFEFDFKEIYYSFRKKFFWNICNRKLKHKAFHKIWTVLRKQKYFEEKIQNTISDLGSKYNSQVGLYYVSLEEFRKHNDEIMQKYQGFKHSSTEMELYNYLNKLDQIWLDWHNLGKVRTFHYYSYNKLVIPLLDLNREYSDLEISLKPATLLLNCFSKYAEIENTIISYNAQFKIFHRIYVDDQKMLRRCLFIIR